MWIPAQVPERLTMTNQPHRDEDSMKDELINKIKLLGKSSFMGKKIEFGSDDIPEIISLVQSNHDGWIDVNDALPEKKGQYDIWNGVRRLTDHWFTGEYFINPLATHWRNRPSPPKVDKA